MTAEPDTARRYARFAAVCGLLVLAYVVAVPLAWSSRGFAGESGPLSLHHGEATAVPAGATVTLDAVRARCGRLRDVSKSERVKVVAAIVAGQPLFACYGLKSDGDVRGAAVLDGDGNPTHQVGLIKRSGAWRWIGTVKTVQELVLGGLAMIAIAALCFLYYRRPRPGPVVGGGWFRSRWVDGVLAVFGPPGWLVLAADQGRPGARKLRVVMMSVIGFVFLVTFVLLNNVSNYPDPVGWTVAGLIAAQICCCVGVGRLQLAPAGWGTPVRPGQPGRSAVRRAPTRQPQTAGLQPAPAGALTTAATTSSTTTSSGGGTGEHRRFPLNGPAELPSFAQVGGMDEVKAQLQDTFGLLLAFTDEADAYRITFNGVLLHGPTGTGKTFLAQATAGEFGLSFVRVSVAELMSKFVGESAQNVATAFAFAAANMPCLLFFDEFDSVAARRDDEPNEENRRVVNQLLTSLEQYRTLRELVVMAATNSLDRLDPAVVRPGRFDRHIRVDLPDLVARQAILTAQLRGRPTAADIDVAQVARRTDGVNAASLTAVVAEAAMAAFREATAGGDKVPISTAHLLGALAARGGKDRPTAENWSWDRLVLDDATKAELRQVQLLLEDPEKAAAYGIAPPSGILLTGPPGTGKTTIGRVLAAEAHCSFYPITAADLTSKWVGESEANVARLFARARDNAPSIVFLDEIDAVAAARGEVGGYADRMLNQLLAEIDGLGGHGRVMVIGATNRPDILDPALTRGGRLSRVITVGLPDVTARRRLLGIYTTKMPLHEVDLDAVAAAADGLSGADLEALCQQAAVVAMTRTAAEPASVTPRVSTADFDTALGTVLQSRRRTASSRQDASMASFLDALTAAPAPPTRRG